MFCLICTNFSICFQYNVPIMASQHDMVNEFISDHLKSVKLALQKPDSSMKQFEMVDK